MNLSAKHGRFLRAAAMTAESAEVSAAGRAETVSIAGRAEAVSIAERAEAVSIAELEDVVVIGKSLRAHYHTESGLSSVQALVEAAQRRAAEIIASAELEAASIISRTDATRAAAYRDGFECGAAEGIRNAHAEIEDLVTLARSACADGMVIRDQVAASSTALLASAVAVATRRIVAEWYDADPARTSAICIEALRAASGQDILSVRVHPSVASQVQAALGNSGTYVRPNDAVVVGGCIIDLAGGTLDASLDTRLSLLELGLQRTVGGAQ